MKRRIVIALAAFAILVPMGWACFGNGGIRGRLAANRAARQAARNPVAPMPPAVAQAVWAITETAPAKIVEVEPIPRPMGEKGEKPPVVGEQRLTAEQARMLQEYIDRMEARLKAKPKVSASLCSEQCVCGCNEGGPCPCLALRRETGRNMEYRPDPATRWPTVAPAVYAPGGVYSGGDCANGSCGVPPTRFFRR